MLWNEGETVKDIARKMNRTIPSVDNMLVSLRKEGRIGKRLERRVWSKKEEKLLASYYYAGYPVKEIARKLNRDLISVVGKKNCMHQAGVLKRSGIALPPEPVRSGPNTAFNKTRYLITVDLDDLEKKHYKILIKLLAEGKVSASDLKYGEIENFRYCIRSGYLIRNGIEEYLDDNFWEEKDDPKYHLAIISAFEKVFAITSDERKGIELLLRNGVVGSENKPQPKDILFRTPQEKWSDEDVKKLMKYWKWGYTIEKISEKIGRSRASVYGKATRLRSEGILKKRRHPQSKTIFV